LALAAGDHAGVHSSDDKAKFEADQPTTNAVNRGAGSKRAAPPNPNSRHDDLPPANPHPDERIEAHWQSEAFVSGQCVLNAVNRGLGVQGVRGAITVKDIKAAKAALYELYPEARLGAFGEDGPDPSVTIKCVYLALRTKLDQYHIVIHHVLRDDTHALLTMLSAQVKDKHEHYYLLDGDLNREWFPGDCDTDWHHLVFLSTLTNTMYEFAGNENLKYEIVDTTTKGSDQPTLCGRRGRMRGLKTKQGCPYYYRIRKLYLFKVAKRTRKRSKSDHI